MLTDIDIEQTWIGIGLSIIIFIIFKLYGLILIGVLIPLTQQTTHRCTNCKNKVGTRNFYDSISLSDKVIYWKTNSFAILITRKQLLGVFVFLFFALAFYVFFSNINLSRGSNMIYLC